MSNIILSGFNIIFSLYIYTDYIIHINFKRRVRFVSLSSLYMVMLLCILKKDNCGVCVSYCENGIV